MIIAPQVLVEIAVRTADEKKAEDITVLDISNISVITDYFVICSGRSSIHVQAIAEEIMKSLERETKRVPRKEGLREGRWVLLDYGDVVVHVFQESERQFYNLERLWGDARVVDVPVNL